MHTLQSFLIKSKKIALLTIGTLAIIGLSGCARYKVKPLHRLSINKPLHTTTQETVHFSYKAFNARDCKQYLDRNVLRKGYQPVHLTIVNNSPQTLNFLIDNISLPCVHPQEVSQKVELSVAKRAVGYGIAGLFLWPFLVAAVVDSIGANNANEDMHDDFAAKTLHSQLILPFTTINGLIFVPTKDFNDVFSITLVDIEDHSRLKLSSIACK